MTTIHDNNFEFKKGRGISSISFKWNEEYIISDGQPWGGVVASEGSITIKAGRHGSSKCADWYKNYVSNNTVNMVHTTGGSKDPSDLNFAIKGTLTVNGYSFEICLGQGHHVTTNN